MVDWTLSMQQLKGNVYGGNAVQMFIKKLKEELETEICICDGRMGSYSMEKVIDKLAGDALSEDSE